MFLRVRYRAVACRSRSLTITRPAASWALGRIPIVRRYRLFGARSCLTLLGPWTTLKSTQKHWHPGGWKLRTFRGLGMLTGFARVNRRMHNKAFVAGNQRAVLGGRNIADEYFDASGDLAFADLDVLTMGPAVADVSEAFETYWNAPDSVPIGWTDGHGREPDSTASLID